MAFLKRVALHLNSTDVYDLLRQGLGELVFHALVSVVASQRHASKAPTLTLAFIIVRRFASETASCWIRRSLAEGLKRVACSGVLGSTLARVASAYDSNGLATMHNFYLSNMTSTRLCGFVCRALTFGYFDLPFAIRARAMEDLPQDAQKMCSSSVLERYLIPGVAELLADQLHWPLVYINVMQMQREDRRRRRQNGEPDDDDDDGSSARTIRLGDVASKHLTVTIFSVSHLVVALLVRSAGGFPGRCLGWTSTAFWGEMYATTILNFILSRFFRGHAPIEESSVEPPKSADFSDGDLYKILGVSVDASSTQIHRAYREKSLMFHPDRHASSTAAERSDASDKFKAINEAHKILTDRRQRAMYDAGVLETSASSSVATATEGSNIEKNVRRRAPPFANYPVPVRIVLAASIGLTLLCVGLPAAIELNIILWFQGSAHPGTLMLRLLQENMVQHTKK
eukprot:PhM_4_TR17613/c0_g1_i1/m.40364